MNKNKEKHHAADKPHQGGPVQARPGEIVNGLVQDPGSAETGTAAAQAAPAPTETKGTPAESGTGKLQEAAQEIDRLKDQLLRLRADFDNYRKRSLREKSEIYENANEALMLELLPAIDHLQLALDSAGKHKADEAFVQGLQLIADQLMTVLSKYGLEPFHSDKKQFDPNLHEAISCLPSENEPEGTVITQSRQGYRFKNKILRPAQVVVSSGNPRPPQSPAEENNQQPAED